MQARKIIIERLRQDLMGPRVEDELLDSRAAPKDQYLTGILYPQSTEVPQEEDGECIEEGIREEGNESEIETVNISKSWLPASMGVSFNVSNSDGAVTLLLKVKTAKYLLKAIDEIENFLERFNRSFGREFQGNTEADKEEEEGTETSLERKFWSRQPCISEDVIIQIQDESVDYPVDLAPFGLEGLRLFVKVKKDNDSTRVTVSLINRYENNENSDFQERNEQCFFQTGFTIVPQNGSKILNKRPSERSHSENEALNNMLYRNNQDYATGHICSASWSVEDNSISAEWLPEEKVEDVSPEGDPILKDALKACGVESYSAKELSSYDAETVISILKTLPESYADWLSRVETDEKPSLEKQFQQTAEQQINSAREVITRADSSLDILMTNRTAMEAFQLANKAMCLQGSWQGYELEWRPFQLGFFLVVLESLIHREKDRELMDLLWFPTGGGKTEAYLLIIAFVLFYRKLEKGGLDQDDGVAVISRYTLRALTTDQFQRTTALITACELVRLEALKSLKGSRFSIGLWIGGDSTPNRYDGDDGADFALRHNKHPSPAVIDLCPCCKSKLDWVSHQDTKKIGVYCRDSSCSVSRLSGGLPVHTVDDQIYQERPSVVIGTVDKFIQICRFPDRTDTLFNIGTDYMPPDLILQDELHLISGSLGTVTGLFELAIDSLSSRGGIKPKIIGSTATIQRASEQVKDLFAREVRQFPPPIINSDSSFFSTKRENSSGRIYLGISTAGRTPTYMLQALCGSLLQSISDERFNDGSIDCNPYTTLCTYFNSLRILGGARTLLWEDAQKSKHVYATNRNEKDREVTDLQELTSHISQDELKSTLARLRCDLTNENHIDMLLASVMLSVGVDIPRLGLMVVDGQPKSMSEYIQATSRVGRGNIPGLIITLYNNSKARDRSHYENFKSWHASFYRHVEATSVTPFASRARDRGLRALIVALSLRATDMSAIDPSLTPSRREKIESDVIPLLLERIELIDKQEMDETENEIDSFLDDWESRGKLNYLWNDYRPKESLFISAEKAAQGAALGSVSLKDWTAPNSARDVEPDVGIKVRGRLMVGDYS